MNKNFRVTRAIDTDRNASAVAKGYQSGLEYLPYAVRRALPMCLGRDYSFTFILETGNDTADGIEVEASIETEPVPSPNGIYMSYQQTVKGLPKGERHPTTFYAQRVVEIAAHSIEFINSVMAHARDSSTSMDEVAKLAVLQAVWVRDGLLPEANAPCAAQALHANIYDVDLDYKFTRHM